LILIFAANQGQQRRLKRVVRLEDSAGNDESVKKEESVGNERLYAFGVWITP